MDGGITQIAADVASVDHLVVGLGQPGKAATRALALSLTRRALLASFEAPALYDPGGARFAFVPSSESLLAAAGGTEIGVAAYRFSGKKKRIWRRPDLKGIQSVTYLPHIAGGAAIGVGFARSPYALLELRTGRTRRALRGYRRIWAAADGKTLLTVRGDRLQCRRANDLAVRWEIDQPAPIHVAFGPDAVLLVHWPEGRCRLECRGIDGRVSWQVDSPVALGPVAYHAERASWICVHAGQLPARLVEYGLSGVEQGSVELDGYAGEYGFLAGGSRLVSARGRVLSVPEGKTVWAFEGLLPGGV